MAEVRIDLSGAVKSGREEALRVLQTRVLPWMADQLHTRWPRRTGRSANAWRAEGSSLVNDVPYTPHIRQDGVLALETVLPRLGNEAAARRWTE